MTDLKDVWYKDEGVATAVGAIFAILIFIFLLSLFITSYVPAEMRSYEEQYSSGVTNDMMQFISAVSLLSVNYQQGGTVSVTFNLQSNYVPLFSTPTVGELSLSSATRGANGYISVNNSTVKVSSGGTLSVLTNNRYFVDEAFSYEFSTLFYEQHASKPLINSTLQSNLLQIGAPANGTINLFINLFNLTGGPFNVSSQSPLGLTVTSLSKNTVVLKGNFTLIYSSTLGEQLYNSLEKELSVLSNVSVTHSNEGNGYMQIAVNSDSIPIVLNVSEFSVLVSTSG